MAQAIGFLFFGSASGLSIAGIALTTATGALTFAGQLFNIAGSLLLSSAFKPDRPKPPMPEDVQLNIRQAVGPRIRHYGRVRVGGTVVFFRAKAGKFYRVVVHGHGEIDGIEAVFLNKGAVTLDGAGFVTEAQYTSGARKRVQVLTRLGSVPETHYAEITAIWPEWDAAHRLDGLWTSLTIAEQVPPNDYRRVYPNNEPGIEIVARTTRLRDPRTGGVAYSENAALAIADLIESPDGFNRAGYVDDTMLAEAADDADGLVPLAAGGTEPRWRLCGSYALNERPGDVLRRMLDACGGDVRLLPNGRIGIEMAKARTASVTLTSADVLEIAAGDDGPDQLDRYNTLPFTFVDPALAFQQTEGDPWHDAARADADGEEMRGGLADLNFAPSHRQARHAARIMLGRANPRQRLTIRCRPRAMLALYESVVQVTIPEAAVDGLYRVEGYALGLRDGAVTLRLSSVDQSDFTWATADEGQAQVLPDPDVSLGIPAPANFAAGPQGVQTSGSSFTAGIAAAWDAPTSDALTAVFEYTTAGGSAWTIVPVSPGTNAVAVGGLADGALYDTRVKFVAADGAASPYATDGGVQALASTAAPAAPTGLGVTDLTGGVARVAFTASASANLWKTEIYRDDGGGAVLVATIYTDPSEAVTVDDASGAGTFDWTARSINVSGVANAADAGPVTQTIT